MSIKTIIITGATSGIGKAAALMLASAGHNLALCGRSAEKAASLAAEISCPSERLLIQAFDIGNEEAIKRFIAQCVGKFGTVDVLINCAGANISRSPIEEMATADLEYMLRLNAVAPFIFSREVIPIMKSKKAGLIMNVLSTVCLYATQNLGGYTASKHALRGVTDVLRREVRQYNIGVCSVFPGGTNTTFRANDRPDYLSPETVARAMVNIINMPDQAALDELVIRPFVESNFS